MSELDQQDLICLLRDDTRKVLLLANDISNNYLGDMVDTHSMNKDERLKFARNLEWDYNRYSTIMSILMDQIITMNERVKQLQ